MTEKQQKVLIVADQPEIRGAVQDIFERHYDLTTADNADDAVEKSGQTDFDVILTDFVVPRISGADVASKIKAPSGIALSQMTERLKKVRETVGRFSKDFEAERPADEALLKDSTGKTETILTQIDGQLRELIDKNAKQLQQISGLEEELQKGVKEKEEALEEVEQARLEIEAARKETEQIQLEKEDAQKEIERVRSENEKVRQEIDEVRSKLDAVEKKADEILKEKTEALELVDTVREQKDEALKELEKASNDSEELRSRAAVLEKELGDSVTLVEAALAEKDQIEKKLAEFQEHWEKYRMK